MLIWAGAGIAVKEALVVFTPLTLIVLRFSIAVLLMLCIGLIFRKNEVLGLQRVEKKDIPLFLLGGVLQPFLYFIFETYTYQSFDSPTIAEAMLSTQPIMAPIMAWLLLREQVTRNNILGILISTAGMLLLLLVGSQDFALGNPWGILLAIITVSCSVGYGVILRKIPEKYSSLSIVFYVQLISLVLFYILWGGDILLNTPQSSSILLNSPQSSSILLNSPQHSSILLPSILAVLYLAVLASVTAFILFCFTVRYIGVTRANIFNNVRPVFTALIMWIFFSEQLPVWKWIGIVIIIIGLFISQKQRKT
jgi:drug/metabolite transporter (DMT)-like permease